MTLTFKSKFDGGSLQTFTAESRKQGGSWNVSAKDITGPGFNKGVIQKITGLAGNTVYEFRVKAVNKDGSSGYTNILTATTQGELVIKAAVLFLFARVCYTFAKKPFRLEVFLLHTEPQNLYDFP